MHSSLATVLAATVVAWSPLLGYAQQAPQPAHPPLPAIAIPYDPQFGFILLPVTIHGETLRLLLDHGTDGTLLSGDAMSRVRVTGGVVDTFHVGTSLLHAVTVNQVEFGQDGVFGASELSHYDFVFDGPARRVRLYAIPTDATHATWLPPGVTPGDCTPMLPDDKYPNRVFFDLQANGKALHSMFDSGARFVNINMAAAKVLGLSATSPNVQPIDGQYSLVSGPAILKATHVPLTVGRKHIRVTESPIHIFQDLPRERNPEDAELSLGLFALLDRIFVVSYSTRQVCLGAPHV